MPRPPRIQFPGAIYHVSARGNRREETFRCEADYALYLALVSRIAAELVWEVFAYCLMPNHVHLVFRTKHANVAAGMQRLNGRYAQLFNERYGLSGHLFQGRYSAKLIESEAHALEVARYVVLNPVRARLCIHPCEWPWSSYRATAGIGLCPRFLNVRFFLRQFGRGADAARRAYVAFVNERAPPMAEAA